MAEAMSTDDGLQRLPALELEQNIEQISQDIKVLTEIVSNLHHVSSTWTTEIESKNEKKQDIFRNGSMFHPPHVVFASFFKHLEIKTADISQKMLQVLHALRWHINLWKTHQLHECVKRRPEGAPKDVTYVEKLCAKVCGMVRLFLDCGKIDLTQAYRLKRQTCTSAIPAPALVTPVRQAMQDVLKELVAQCFVVIEQPQLTMMFEKTKKDKDDSNSSKKFDTAVGLLGGRALGDYIEIMGVDICLVFQGDLAREHTLETMPRSKICSEKGRHRHSSRSMESPDLPYLRKYEKLQVEGFSRKETRTVYKQLYHVVYMAQITFRLAQKEFEVPARVISLPVIMRTGANQASEHVGALLWHSFSSINVYDLHKGMETSMSIDCVIQMVNERVLYIGGRGLRQYERQFLHDKLCDVAANGKKKNSNVTLDSFVKDKVELHTLNGSDKQVRPFSLWLWLHSVFNLLQLTLQKPWIDGVIHGFTGREHCKEVLEKPSMPEGTFLLRFSESFRPGNFMMCKGALALVMKRNGKCHFAPPIHADVIEREGLAKAILQAGCVAELNTGFTIQELRELYQPAVQAPQTKDVLEERYQEWEEEEATVTPRPMLTAKRLGCVDKAMAPSQAKMSCSSPPESPESLASPGAYSPGSGPQDQTWINQQFSSSLRSPPSQAPNFQMGSPPPAANFQMGSPHQSVKLQMGSPASAASLQMGSPPQIANLHLRSPPSQAANFLMGSQPQAANLQIGSPPQAANLQIGSPPPAANLQKGSPPPASNLQMGSPAPPANLQMASPAQAASLHVGSPQAANLHMGSPLQAVSHPVVSLVSSNHPAASTLSVLSSTSSSYPVGEFDEQELLQEFTEMLSSNEVGQELSRIASMEEDSSYSELPTSSQPAANFLVGNEDPLMAVQTQ